MRILRLTAENVKRLKAVEIVPDGSVVQITGANGSGKSSVLDAIYWALAGTKGITALPVRQGEQRATITLDLGDVTVIRRFTADGGTSLVVEAENGARFPSPQTMLDKLLGALTFDPLAFSRMAPKQQLETLRGLVTLDVDIDQLDADNQRDYAARTDVSRRARSLAEQVKGLDQGLDPKAPTQPVDISALLVEMERAGEQNAARERELSRRAQRDRNVKEAMDRVEAINRQVQGLLDEKARLEAAIGAVMDERQQERDVGRPVDTAALRSQIEEARAVNAAVEQQARQRQLRDEAHAAMVRASDEAAALTAAMEQRTRMREAAIQAAKMPIDGLSFGAGTVLYKGLPFEQASSAEQLRVSVAIAMAANPKLRVLRIKDGSLLDEASLALIAQMAAAEDYQIWIERVDTSGTVGVVMEDGSVRGVVAVDPDEAAVALAGD